MVIARALVSKYHQEGLKNLVAFENPNTCDLELHTPLNVVILLHWQDTLNQLL